MPRKKTIQIKPNKKITAKPKQQKQSNKRTISQIKQENENNSGKKKSVESENKSKKLVKKVDVSRNKLTETPDLKNQIGDSPADKNPNETLSKNKNQKNAANQSQKKSVQNNTGRSKPTKSVLLAQGLSLLTQISPNTPSFLTSFKGIFDSHISQLAFVDAAMVETYAHAFHFLTSSKEVFGKTVKPSVVSTYARKFQLNPKILAAAVEELRKLDVRVWRVGLFSTLCIDRFVC